MKPLIIACDCGSIISITGIVLFADFEIHVIGYCSVCVCLIKWESTLMQLAERCQRIGAPNKPLIPPTREWTPEDIKLLHELKISEKPPSS